MSELCQKKLNSIYVSLRALKSSNSEEVTIEEVAQACKDNMFEFEECIKCLFEAYDTTSADDMAKLAMKVWYGSVGKADISSALAACVYKSGQKAYTDSQISAAVSANVFLTLEDFYAADTVKNKVISLYSGDLTTLKKTEHTDFLVISALPGDYAPTSVSMIGMLDKKGVSIKAESARKTADYLSDLECWIVTVDTTGKPGLEFEHIVVFEPKDPKSSAVSKTDNIFEAIKRFKTNILKPSVEKPMTVNVPLVCTQSGGTGEPDILRALFYSSKKFIENELLKMVRIGLYNTKSDGLKALFGKLKNE